MQTSIKLPNISPELDANPISKLFLCWILPFIKYGADHTLQFSDIYDTLEKDSARKLTNELKRNWKYELKTSRIKGRKPMFTKALLFSFANSFLVYGPFLVIQSVVIRVLHPIVLAEYIRHFEEKPNCDPDIGYYYGAAIIILAFMNTLIYHHCFFGCSRIGTRAKVACSSLIQNKIIGLSQYSLSKISPSRVVKMLDEDVKKIESVAPFLHYLWIAPLQFLTSTYISLHAIGPASLTGLFFMLIICIPQTYMSALQKEIQRQLSTFTESRVKAMKEILYGIRVIKISGWESPFEKIIGETRVNELRVVSQKLFIKCCSTSILMFNQTIAIFLTLTTHIITGNELKTEMVFAVVLIFSNLQQYMTYFFPEAIDKFLDAREAMLRIESFLSLEEKEDQIKVITYTKAVKKPGTIQISEATINWGPLIILQDINLKVSSGNSYCIFGPPRSGKTSFLQMILKEMPVISGRVDVVGTVSYASQKPWLFTSTIKRNILFGQPYNRQKYREIIKICSLNKDFQKLPFGDETLTNDKICSENGIKEKISLARAFYKEADIYIIDHSFEQIDFEEEKFIFSEGIMKYLKDKTRIFVSNDVHHAKEADKIVVVENGCINKIIETKELTDADLQFLNSKISVEKSDFISPQSFMEDTDTMTDCEIGTDEFKNNIGKRGYFTTIGEFLKLDNKYLMGMILVLLIIFATAFASLSDFWLTQWNFKKPIHPPTTLINKNQNNSSLFQTVYLTVWKDVAYGLMSDEDNSSLREERTQEKPVGVADKDFFICCYALFIACCLILTVARTLLYHAICMNASRVLVDRMFEKVMYSPLKFFETFPSGTILQRFSKDVDVINGLLFANFATWQMYSGLCGTILLILIATPTNILPLMLIITMIYFLVSAFVSTIRNLQRLEHNAHLSICSFLSSSFHGVFTIRSAEAEELISEVFENLLDTHTGIWTTILAASEYFSLYMDILAIIFMGIATFIVVVVKIDSYYYIGYIGLAVSQGIILTELLHLGIRESIETICGNATMDRTLKYTQLVTENVDRCTLVPKSWPFCGKIVFKNVYVRDNDANGSFLKNLNIVIGPAEKVAVVSRYPEEKWTIMNSLLRLVSVEGLVILDDVDTSAISLNRLRSSISVITKEPVLFTGSVRYNLDPLNYASDDMLWAVLEEVGLKTCIQSLSQPVIKSGLNYTCGQKHLLCLARVLLKNNKIIIIENSPNDIDTSTEKTIQKIIRQKFKKCTVITIANSLNTIMENDKILVIEDGKEVEYAHAHQLLQNPNGYLTNLVKKTGPKMEQNLLKIAKNDYESRNLQIEFTFQ